MGLKVREMVRIQARLPSGSYCLNKEKKNKQPRQTVAGRKTSLKCEWCQSQNLYIFWNHIKENNILVEGS